MLGSGAIKAAAPATRVCPGGSSMQRFKALVATKADKGTDLAWKELSEAN